MLLRLRLRVRPLSSLSSKCDKFFDPLRLRRFFNGYSGQRLGEDVAPTADTLNTLYPSLHFCGRGIMFAFWRGTRIIEREYG